MDLSPDSSSFSLCVSSIKEDGNKIGEIENKEVDCSVSKFQRFLYSPSFQSHKHHETKMCCNQYAIREYKQKMLPFLEYHISYKEKGFEDGQRVIGFL